MLSERVLEELVRRSELSQELTAALWPDLCVESKLQLMVAYQADFSPTTPAWLTDLALADESPVVQYFALRHAYLETRHAGRPENIYEVSDVSDEDVARHARAHAIDHPLVRAVLSDFSLDGVKMQLLHSTQLERLAHVRNANLLGLNSLIDFLEEALDRLDDQEVAEVAYEYFLRPDTKHAMQRGTDGFSDGDMAYSAGRGIKRGWELARKAGPVLANVLVTSLPTALGLATVEAEVLATMPDHVLELLAFDASARKEIRDLHRLMREQPGRFPTAALRARELLGEVELEADELEEQHDAWRESPLGERAMLDAILELQKQVVSIAEQLRELRTPPQKRGFFG